MDNKIVDEAKAMQESFKNIPVKFGDAEFSAADFLILVGTAIQFERTNNRLDEKGAEAAHNVISTLLWLIHTGDYKLFLDEYNKVHNPYRMNDKEAK